MKLVKEDGETEICIKEGNGHYMKAANADRQRCIKCSEKVYFLTIP